jgi:hypothetical protein
MSDDSCVKVAPSFWAVMMDSVAEIQNRLDKNQHDKGDVDEATLMETFVSGWNAFCALPCSQQIDQIKSARIGLTDFPSIYAVSINKSNWTAYLVKVGESKGYEARTALRKGRKLRQNLRAAFNLDT